MAVIVTLKNPNSGDIKQVKVGWSWTLFLFSAFFGLPLFLRKLHTIGFIFLALWLLNFVISSFIQSSEEALISYLILQAIFLGLIIWMGIKGNELTAKNLLEKGWTFSNVDSDEVKFAKGKWGVL